MSAFLDETGVLITVDHSNPLPVALVAGFTSLNDGELKTASYANPLPVTVVTTDYTDAELPTADSVAVGTEVFNTTYQVKMRSNGTTWEWLGVGKSAWANKPAIAPLGQVICITDVGENGSLWRGNGTKWIKLHAVKYYNNTTPVSLTGTTAETTMLTIPVKGGLIGANGVLAIQPLWSNTNNANNKTLRIKLEATTCYSYGAANLSHQDGYINVRNIGSESSQKTTSGMAGGTGGTVNNYNSTSTDTSVDFNIVVTGQLANSADTMAIQAFLIMVL